MDQEESATGEDRGIKVILESESWRFIGTKAHFGLYNKSGSPKQYTFKLTEILEEDLLSAEVRDKFIFFDSLYKQIDAQQVSQNDRSRFNVCDKTEFTYGEVLFPYFIPLFELTQPKEGEVFWDLGCGGGRPLVIASLNFP